MFVSGGSNGFKFEQKHFAIISEKTRSVGKGRAAASRHAFSGLRKPAESEDNRLGMTPYKSGAVYQALSGRDRLLHQVTPQLTN